MILMAAVLAGCSTTVREIRTHAPSATYTSQRSEPELEQCLAGNLSWISNPAIIHGPSSTELTFGGGGSIVVMVSLIPTAAGGTNVEAREILAYGVRVRNNIEACVTGRDR